MLGALTLVKEIACGSRRIDGCCIEIGGGWLRSCLTCNLMGISSEELRDRSTSSFVHIEASVVDTCGSRFGVGGRQDWMENSVFEITCCIIAKFEDILTSIPKAAIDLSERPVLKYTGFVRLEILKDGLYRI